MSETCDYCKLVFTSAKPAEAKVDAKIKGLGVWGYLCEGHESHAVPGTATELASHGA
jgi:hypothetical protein